MTLPAIPGLAEQGYLTPDEALALTDLPQRLVIVGEGASAVELGRHFARLGVKVTLLQRQPGGAPSEEGLIIKTGVTIHEVTRHGRLVMVVAHVEGRRTSFHGEALVAADHTTR
ncbi:MAG: FAD-dependent oxidoreductase [Nitrospirota bacterium]